jgi:hypothetical protein
MAIGVGALTTGVIATVDERGVVDRGDVALEWRVRAGDRWIDPTSDVSVRTSRVGPGPVAETAVRVPGGDAVGRAYAVGDHGGVVIVEVENASPEAVAVAFAVRDAPAADVLALPRRPGAIEPDGAVVFPVPHRTVLRVALGDPTVEVRTLPDWQAVGRGWVALLDRGMRTELPEPWQSQIDAARADVLLAGPSPEAFVALEDWGFDDEAATMWPQLGLRARRAAGKARRRNVDTGVLGELRAALVREHDPDVDLLPGFRSEWLGAHLAVHDVPLRRGQLSFALRWHGARPALLWEAPPGTVLRATAIDPAWQSTTAAGETLLAAPADGTRVAIPDSFS